MEYYDYSDLLDNNRRWVDETLKRDPEYFAKLAEGQHPPFLYIGCSDSRKPLNTITQTRPGEVFIHRNVANQISLTDMNLLSVLEFAIESLKVKHVIVCGHYGCGGVTAAYRGTATGLVENWVTPIKDLALVHKDELNELSTEEDRLNRLSELNVLAQVRNLCKTSILHRAFARGDYPQLHGWIFAIRSGLIQEQQLPLGNWKELGLIPKDYPGS
ncbi:MAG: carbonic anhydrase [Planctomycetota bacterium]|nr:carbonic anhydrase [Planctomycetota bacterium]